MNLKFKLKKYKFRKKKIKYLKYKISEKRIYLNSNKVKVINQIFYPIIIKDIKTFLSITSFLKGI